MSELSELHEKITQQIIEEVNQEMEESIAEKRAAVKKAKQQEQKELKALKEAEFDLSKLEALNSELGAEAEKELKAIEAQMDKESDKPSTSMIDLDVESAFLPPEAFVLTPSWSSTFSDQDDQDKLTGGAAIERAQALLTSDL
jgi:regulator of protease activity HflC (stomatin/prohibitin superfamily)